ncbi:hypothetical protein LXL04_010737 [Taraxacum kok-saghyz]
MIILELLFILQETLKDLKSDYNSYEDILFGKSKSVYFAASYPFATTGLVVGSGVLAVKSIRHALYYNTLIVFLSNECEISSDKSLREEFMEGEHMVDTGDVEGTSVISPLKENVPEEDVSVVVPSNTLVTLKSQDELQNENIDSVIEEQLEDMSAEIQQVNDIQEEVKDDSEMNQKYAQESSSVERVRRKQRSSPFPFKRLLKTSQFKKKLGSTKQRAQFCKPSKLNFIIWLK